MFELVGNHTVLRQNSQEAVTLAVLSIKKQTHALLESGEEEKTIYIKNGPDQRQT